VKANEKFLKQPKSFWANVRTISQAVGYTETAEGYSARSDRSAKLQEAGWTAKEYRLGL
jgi:hypothetical protein